MKLRLFIWLNDSIPVSKLSPQNVIFWKKAHFGIFWYIIFCFWILHLTGRLNSSWNVLVYSISNQNLVTIHYDFFDNLLCRYWWCITYNIMNVITLQIRSAFYSLVTSLCMTYPETSGCYADRLCPSILHRLDDSDLHVCSHLWEAMVAVITQIQVPYFSWLTPALNRSLPLR